MPKKPPRNNPVNRVSRTVQSAASVLHRLAPRAVGAISPGNSALEAIRARLPEGLRPHVRHAVEKSDELVILTDSAAWAARLRLALAALPATAEEFRRTTVKVAPPGSVPTRISRR